MDGGGNSYFFSPQGYFPDTVHQRPSQGTALLVAHYNNMAVLAPDIVLQVVTNTTTGNIPLPAMINAPDRI